MGLEHMPGELPQLEKVSTKTWLYVGYLRFNFFSW